MSELEPLVAAPHSPDNRKTAHECSSVKIDRVYIGCAIAPAPSIPAGSIRSHLHWLSGGDRFECVS